MKYCLAVSATSLLFCASKLRIEYNIQDAQKLEADILRAQENYESFKRKFPGEESAFCVTDIKHYLMHKRLNELKLDNLSWVEKLLTHIPSFEELDGYAEWQSKTQF